MEDRQYFLKPPLVKSSLLKGTYMGELFESQELEFGFKHATSKATTFPNNDIYEKSKYMFIIYHIQFGISRHGS
jgi:hypothetical protein